MGIRRFAEKIRSQTLSFHRDAGIQERDILAALKGEFQRRLQFTLLSKVLHELLKFGQFFWTMFPNHEYVIEKT